MKKLISSIAAITSIIIISSNTMLTLATISSFEKININKRQTTLEPQPGSSWQNDNLPSLYNVIQNKYLGPILDFRSETILIRLQELNPNLDISDIYISNITDDTAIIRPLTSRQYSGSTMISFINTERIRIKDFILSTNLNNISNFTQEGILQHIKKLNPEIDITQLYVDSITQNSAVVKPLPDSKLYEGNVRVRFKKEGTIVLSELTLNRNLGTIPDYNPRTILTRLRELNPGIDTSQLYVQNIIISGATIKILPNSQVYHRDDYINICFNMPFLSSIIMNSNLGEIENNNENTILGQLRELNPGIDIFQLYVQNITENSATISPLPDSMIYQGQITVTFFNQKKRLFLHRVIKNTELILSDFKVNTILEQLRELNPEIDITQLVVKKVSNKKYARITAIKNSSIYRGELMIRLTLNTINSLTSNIVNTNLGRIPDNNIQTILDYLQRYNTNININEIYIEAVNTNSATISALPSSLIYYGRTVIYFNLATINDVIMNSNLGE
ncbi:MAG: hypothetical protein ACRC8P_03210, partial [Spiroplasma sp.]